jgi:SAM-dependent methyltransferase
MSQADDAATHFAEHAERYDRAYDARSGDGHALRARLDVALRLAGPGPGEALDAGMGPGRLLSELAEHGWTVSGVDPAAEMVAKAGLRLPTAVGRLVTGRAELLPFSDSSFDLVVATGVLEFVNPPRAVSELARVLRPGGRAIVSYPNGRALYGLWKTRVFYRAVRMAKRVAPGPRPGPPGGPGAGLLTLDEFGELFATAGLRIETTEFASFLVLPSPLDLLLPGLAERLGRRLEGQGPRLGTPLATQIVFAARKLGPASTAP